MPDGLTRIAALVLAALAFGLTFAIQALGGGSADPKPVAQRAREPVASNPAPGADLSLTAARAVPALRNPRQRRVRARRKPARRKRRAVRKVVTPAPTADPVAVPDTAPAPTATPRYIPTPAPRYVAPAPRPRPKPAPTSAPEPSGDFDSAPEPSGEFDSSGEP
jgi:hypothetical protein